MGALVLHWDVWPIAGQARGLAEGVAAAMGVRATALDHRPHLGIYDVVVLCAPTVAQLDPRLQLMAADGELRGKTVALLTDAPGPWPQLAWAEWTTLASVLGGAHLYEAHLHLGPWLPASPWPGPGGWEAQPAARDRAREWGKALAAAFPAPTYPRGQAGRRAM